MNTYSNTTRPLPAARRRTLPEARETAARWHRAWGVGAGLDRRVHADVAIGFVSLALVAVAGLAINILVGRFYSPDILGQFSQVFALYVLAAQFAAAGCQYSAVKYVADCDGDTRREARVIAAALLVAAATSALSCLAFWSVRQSLAACLQSPGVARGLAWATPALFLFTLNKVAMAALNGQRRMRWYAGLQAARPVLLMMAVGVAVGAHVSGKELPAIFLFSEAVILLACLIPLRIPLWSAARERTGWPAVREHARRHFHFGIRSVFSGVLLQLNTRLDILMLGWWTNDHVVGVYALAATFAEGLSQLPLLFRRNFNPLLAQLSARENTAELQRLIQSGKRYVTWVVGIVTGLCLACFPLLIRLATGKLSEYWLSWPILAILAAGLVASAGSVAFRQLLLQAGYPGTYTGVLVACCALNVALNSLLIPLGGAGGAALATTLSMLVSVWVMRGLIRRTLNVLV